jgi:hypothetical protein
MEGASYGVSAAMEALVGSESVGDQDDTFRGSGGGWRDGEGQNLSGYWASEGSEAEAATLVLAENEADESVAEDADAVVEHDGVTGDLCTFGFSHSRYFGCACHCDFYTGSYAPNTYPLP